MSIKKLSILCIFLLPGIIANLYGQEKSLKFETDDHDFGNVPENDGPVTYKFKFTNEGKKAVVIKTVRASCGCTTPDWTKESINPGDSGFVTAQYNPKGRPGEFRKTLTVYYADDKNKTEDYELLKIKGEVIQDIEEKMITSNARAVRPKPYSEYFTYNNKDIKDQAFVNFIDSILLVINEEGKVELRVESSASHVPTYQFPSNDQLARKRAQDAMDRIYKAVEAKGVSRNKVIFARPEWKVQGPEYKNDYIENRLEYEKYQYVKVVPL